MRMQNLRCAVEACGRRATMEYVTSSRVDRLCDEHADAASAAVNEVMDHLARTGETYLPGTAATVLVEYVVDPSREGEFRTFRELNPGNPAGLIGETLYWADWDDSDDGNFHFVNIGHWTDRESFYRHFNATPGVRPAQKDFEVSPRRRAWLRRDS